MEENTESTLNSVVEVGLGFCLWALAVIVGILLAVITNKPILAIMSYFGCIKVFALVTFIMAITVLAAFIYLVLQHLEGKKDMIKAKLLYIFLAVLGCLSTYVYVAWNL